jgi:hypothetical protein
MRSIELGSKVRSGGPVDPRVRMTLAALSPLLLAMGLLIYLTARPPGSAAALPPEWHRPSVTAVYLLREAGWLPSLLHPWAFGLLSAAVATSRPWQLGACIAWGGANLLFEVGQHPALAEPLTQAFGAWPPATALTRYFASGAFDPADLAAAAAGTVAACACVLVAARGREKPHA